MLEDPAHERSQDVEVVGRRVVACLFDCFLAALPSSVAFAPLLFARPSLLLALALLFILLFCVLYFFYIVFEGFRGGLDTREGDSRDRGGLGGRRRRAGT